MLTRQYRNASRKKAELQAARRVLSERGWTQRAAAPLLGVHFCHLCRVLNGQRESRALLARIHALPQRQHAA